MNSGAAVEPALLEVEGRIELPGLQVESIETARCHLRFGEALGQIQIVF